MGRGGVAGPEGDGTAVPPLPCGGRVGGRAPPAAGGAPWAPTAAGPRARAGGSAGPTAWPTTCHGVALRFAPVTRLPDTITSAAPAPGIAKRAPTSGEPLASSGDANRRTPP